MSGRSFFLTVVLVVVALAGWAGWSLMQPLRTDGDVLLVRVIPGETPGGVLARMDAEVHALHYTWPLRAWLRLRGGAGMRAGEYEFRRAMPAWEVVEGLLSGQSRQQAFTLVEGWNFRQLRAALAAEPGLTQQLAVLTDAEIMSRLDRVGEKPEGRFAPDTYFFLAGTSSDLEILGRALAAQDARLKDAWDSRATGLPYEDAGQLLTMASIVEKETGQASERAAIAGVFVRRLQKGMRLQTDPTVIYGMGEAYSGNITRADLLRPTPWNTYVIDGLPPTPIAMPGREALEAAAHPEAGDALYFVGRGDGSHQFSATLDEHNRAVREYQLRRRADYHSAPSP